jgi:hypothetical protein
MESSQRHYHASCHLMRRGDKRGLEMKRQQKGGMLADTDRDRDRDTETQRHRDTDRQTDKQTDMQICRQTEKKRDRCTLITA